MRRFERCLDLHEHVFHELSRPGQHITTFSHVRSNVIPLMPRTMGVRFSDAKLARNLNQEEG